MPEFQVFEPADPTGRSDGPSESVPSDAVVPALDEVTGALEDLTAVLDNEDDFQVLIHQVCRQVTRAIPGVDEASITLLRGGEPYTAATTHPVVVELDGDQYRTGDGPCLQAARAGRVIGVSIAKAERDWPVFAEDARRAGFGSCLSAPLVIRNKYAGAINCYGSNGRGFADLDKQLVELYVTAVEAALRTHQRYAEARETAEQLTIALESRGVIDQAKGILMAAHGINADEAFRLIAEQSQRENIKVRTIAERLVAHVTGPHAHETAEGIGRRVGRPGDLVIVRTERRRLPGRHG